MRQGTTTQGPVGAEAAVCVAERGLTAWREAKIAWLDSFAVFDAQECALSGAAPRIAPHDRGACTA